MEGLDTFGSDEESTTEETSGASVSYIEVKEDEHPNAYSLISGQGPIRSFFRGKDASVNDFFADLVEALGPFFEEGDKVPLLHWLGPSEEDVETYLEEVKAEADDDEDE